MTTTTSTSRRSSADAASATIRRADRAAPVAHVRCSTRADGDFHRTNVPLAELEPRRRALVDLPWSMLDEHHGVGVREVTRPGEHDGATGDVLVTGRSGAVLGCWVADCAPVVLIGVSGRIAVAHAGWRGLASGVLDVALDALAEPVGDVALGPTIGPCCYEFGAAELEQVAHGLGVSVGRVAARTRDGRTALDVAAAVGAFATRHGATYGRLGGCTGCTYPGFSHRARRDPQRHVVAVWQDPA